MSLDFKIGDVVTNKQGNHCTITDVRENGYVVDWGGLVGFWSKDVFAEDFRLIGPGACNPQPQDTKMSLGELKEKVAVKLDAGKIPYELVPTAALAEICKVLEFGKKKYAADNWRSHGGFAWRRLIGAAMRHLFAFSGGEDNDPETGFSHIAHLGCCVLFLLEHILMKLGKDDRFKYNDPLKDVDIKPVKLMGDTSMYRHTRYDSISGEVCASIDGETWVQIQKGNGTK